MNHTSFFTRLWPMAVALAAGAAIPFQAAVNALLGRALGHPLWATMASLSVSVLVTLPLLLLMRAPAPNLGAALQGPWWLWLGGAAGVLYITAALMLTPRMGAASFIVCVVAGQMVASLALDYFGLLGLPARPVGVPRLAGVGLILLGMVLVQMEGKNTPPAPSNTAVPDVTKSSGHDDKAVRL